MVALNEVAEGRGRKVGGNNHLVEGVAVVQGRDDLREVARTLNAYRDTDVAERIFVEW